MKSYCLLFWALVLTTTTQLSSAQKPPKPGTGTLDASSLEWPKIFTAVVPAPGTETQLNSGDTYFASDIDLLDIIETGLPSPFDGTGTDFMKVSFMVHSEDELKRLTELTVSTPGSDFAAHDAAHASNLELDTDLTLEVQQESKPQSQESQESEESQVEQQDFSTIEGFPCYKNVAGSFDWMDHMVDRATSIPNLSITLSDIGDSYLKSQNSNDGYDIKVLRVTGNGVATVPGRTTEKGILFMMTGIHARELAPPELVSRWIESMVDGYGTDAEKTSILDHTVLHFVIHANPDGRYTVENDLNSYRRKNMNPSGGNSCGSSSLGVDLNRNFPFKWGLNSGSSNNPCDQTYRGLSPASEPEVQAIVNYCESIFPEGQRKSDPEGDKQVAFPDTAKGIFMDTHSYSEIIIWPWGHENLETGNDSQMEALVAKYRHFNGYGFSGPGNGFLYEASGATDDWAYGALGAAGFTFELGTTFYQTCSYFEDDILPKNTPALTYAAKSTTAPYRIPKGPDVTSVTANVANGGNSLVVTASASDSAYSSSDHPSSRQGVSEVRAFVNIHPYDLENGQAPLGEAFANQQSITIDISGFEYGRYTVYIQAEDGDGFIGPVTAAYFTKHDPNADPTSSPVNPTPSPTNAPTPCIGGNVVVEILTDNYPAETSWTLVNTCTDVEVATGGPYTSQVTEYIADECVPSIGEFKFTITDSYGDGMCCSYGEGGYKVSHNGISKGIGGDYGSEADHEFGSSCDSPVDPTPSPVDQTPSPVDPTPSPVDPTPSPVDPTPSPVDSSLAPVSSAPVEIPDESWVTIFEEGFENSGSDSVTFNNYDNRINTNFFHQGVQSVRLRKTQKVTSKMKSVRNHSGVKVDFFFQQRAWMMVKYSIWMLSLMARHGF